MKVKCSLRFGGLLLLGSTLILISPTPATENGSHGERLISPWAFLARKPDLRPAILQTSLPLRLR